MTETVQEPIQHNARTRRALLTRDLKAICAMVVATIAGQTMLPKSASAGNGGGNGGGNGNGKCFLKGTRILTAAGERRVEELAAGDLVPAVFGGMRSIQSIERFRRVRSETGQPWATQARPVHIARSALAPNVPHADLYVTQGHALLFNDLLVPAGSLVNNTTISLEPAAEQRELEFFHIKLESHDVIYAEGTPCETLLQADETSEVHCAPIICQGPRSELGTRLRGLMSPWLGPQKFDSIRMDLELRAMALAAAA